MENVIKFAVIGAAERGIGRVHLRGMANIPYAKCVAVCDIHEEFAVDCAKVFGIEKVYTDYKDMLAAGGFDAVIVATPDQVHREQAIAALEAGYHVLCEKPLAMEMEDCQAIVDAAKKSTKKFMVGQVARKNPPFALLKQLVDRGEVGELFFVESEYAHNYDIIPDIDGWRHDPVHLRHPVVGGGCHAMDLLRWIAGNPTEVTAYANHKALPNWPVDDCTISILKYPNNVIGKVMVSIGCHRPYAMRTCIYGTKGTLIYESDKDGLMMYKEFYNPMTDRTNYLPTWIPIERKGHNMQAEIEEFCDIIYNDLPVECDVIQGANTVAVCRAAVESAAIGAPVAPKYFS